MTAHNDAPVVGKDPTQSSRAFEHPDGVMTVQDDERVDGP
jgi:hypothetical protein